MILSTTKHRPTQRPTTPTQPRAARGKTTAALLGLILSASVAAPALAQTYTAYDLSASSPNSTAKGISAGVAAGNSGTVINSLQYHATLWNAAGQIDLHPSFLDDAAAGIVGRSSAEGIAGNLQVGWGFGVGTGGRTAAMAWRGSAASAISLSIPFVNSGSQATATDGQQIVGYGYGLTRDGAAGGPSRAILWDAATGAATDLGDGGRGAMAYGVGGGQQVGYVIKSQASAALWSGSSRTLVVLHPSGAVLSSANGTDGTRQVGYAGFDVRVRNEAAKGNKYARFNNAMVWSGTAASALNIHPYPVNADPNLVFTHSYALGVAGNRIVGYAADNSKIGTPAYYHAIVWDENFQSVDLNAFLPAGFVGAQATSVDADGNIAGYMSKADGTRHAVIWVPDAIL